MTLRNPGTVGLRAEPLGAGETYSAPVSGVHGECDIPVSATAAAMNITVVNPTSSSFLTVFPADASRPMTSNINWIADQAATANAVTSGLSAEGAVGLYNESGTIDLLIDVVVTSSQQVPASPGAPGTGRC